MARHSLFFFSFFTLSLPQRHQWEMSFDEHSALTQAELLVAPMALSSAVVFEKGGKEKSQTMNDGA